MSVHPERVCLFSLYQELLTFFFFFLQPTLSKFSLGLGQSGPWSSGNRAGPEPGTCSGVPAVVYETWTLQRKGLWVVHWWSFKQNISLKTCGCNKELRFGSDSSRVTMDSSGSHVCFYGYDNKASTPQCLQPLVAATLASKYGFKHQFNQIRWSRLLQNRHGHPLRTVYVATLWFNLQ